MRAAPRAGSRTSRRRPPLAVALAVALAAVVALSQGCGHAPARAMAGVSATASASLPPGAAPPFDDAGYWAYADRLQRRLEPMWDQRLGRYRTDGGGCESMVNALMLLTHSVAAQAGHHGPSRQDARARLIARALVSAPAFLLRRPPHPGPGSQVHVPGWSSSMAGPGNQHEVFDAEIVDGLVAAWRARRELGLPEQTAALIADRIHRVATSPFWRWPVIRLNQINWYALMYAADATVTDRPAALATPFRRQLDRFVARAMPAAGRAGNLGPALRFHYLPARGLDNRENVDSAEYANIVLSFTRFYGQARAAGMPPVASRERELLRAWVRRAMAGYWTHAGYLNWDSGLGFARWHQAKKLGLAQQALIGIAQAPELQPSPAWGAWAKWMLDRGLAWYARQPAQPGGLPDPVFFGLSRVPQSESSARLAAARVQANAARAVAAGLGRMPAVAPPSLYAYDPDIGRLAVTTPSYNTAIIAVNQRAFPYGGIELARLFDGEQRVAANVGGTGAAGFGVRVLDAAGRSVLASQSGRRRVDPSVTPLRLTRAPSGVGARASSRGVRAYAGPFTDLRETGSVVRRDARVTTTDRFTPTRIETGWRIDRRSGAGPLSADVQFPSWGRAATVTAVLRDGTRRRVSVRGVPLAAVASFVVRSENSGYTLIPLSRPAGARATARRPSPQSSQPHPGPTLTIALAHRARFGRVRLAVRIVVGLSRTDQAS